MNPARLYSTEIRKAAHAANETMVQCEVIYFTRRYNIYWLPRGRLLAAGCVAARGGVIPAMEYSEPCAIFLLFLPLPLGPLHVLLHRDGCTLMSVGMAAHSRPQGRRHTHVLRDGSTLTSTGMAAHSRPQGRTDSTRSCTAGAVHHGLLLDGVVHHELPMARAVHHGLLLAGAVHHGLLLDGVVHHVLLLDGVVHHELLPGGRHRRNDRKKEKLDRIGEKEGIVVSRK